MGTFDCFTDKRTYKPVTTPPRTARAQAYIDAQRASLGPPCLPFQTDAIADAVREWQAHVDAGRIGGAG
ncbi:MAG: hypothetical protein ABIO85_09580 [Sphingomicrobium sp.]